ncbi:hypothetical protein [Klebsiella phage vB_KshKPC-M]|nr:hypothetical protein [Klebsiella phage vB_KshKPC-M]
MKGYQDAKLSRARWLSLLASFAWFSQQIARRTFSLFALMERPNSSRRSPTLKLKFVSSKQ